MIWIANFCNGKMLITLGEFFLYEDPNSPLDSTNFAELFLVTIAIVILGSYYLLALEIQLYRCIKQRRIKDFSIILSPEKFKRALKAWLYVLVSGVILHFLLPPLPILDLINIVFIAYLYQWF